MLNKVAQKKPVKAGRNTKSVKALGNKKDSGSETGCSSDEVEVVSPTKKKVKTEPVTHQEILNFFNNEPVTSFRSIITLNIKKWSVLESLRPFEDYNDLVSGLLPTANFLFDSKIKELHF